MSNDIESEDDFTIERVYPDLLLLLRARRSAIVPKDRFKERHTITMAFEVHELVQVDRELRPKEERQRREPWLEGHVKWDGCANVDFGRLHACQREHLMRLGPLFERIYDLAMEIMPESSEYLDPMPLVVEPVPTRFVGLNWENP